MTTEPIHIDAEGAPIAFAWPGGYPVFYLAQDATREDDGTLEPNPYDRSENVMCPTCANGIRTGEHDAIVTAQEVYWEGAPMFCEYCNAEIESAYGDPDAEDEAAPVSVWDESPAS